METEAKRWVSIDFAKEIKGKRGGEECIYR